METNQPKNTDVFGEECQEPLQLQDTLHVDSNRLEVTDGNPSFQVEQSNFCNGEKQKDEAVNAITVDSSLAAQQRLCLESSNLCKELEFQSVKGNSVSECLTKTDTKVKSDVLAILEEILARVDENTHQPSTDKLCHQSKCLQECIDGNDDDDDEFKHGDKRTYSEVIADDARIEVPTLEAKKDSLYIMNLVETELKAVGQELEENNNMKGKPRLVDYDADSSESSDSSDEESSDTESSSSDDSLIEKRKTIEKMETEEEKMSNEPPKTKDEVLLKDLPPEPEVSIVLPEEVKLVHIGSIMSIVESMVVVKSLPNTPALDVDTLLFLEDRKSFGKVFETFGPVQNPFYSVRFNKPEDIANMNINQGLMVFFAPEDIDFTKLVFVSELKRLKGSDASWKHDQEPPCECLDYSDDEEEAKAKATKKQERKSNKTSSKAQKDEKEKSLGTAVSLPTKLPQHKEPSRNWQGRGRGKRHHENNQQKHPCTLPQQFPRGPPPPLGGRPPHFMGHPPPPGPPFFPGSLPHGVRPPPYPHAPLPGPPPGSYHILPVLQGIPPPWNPARPPAIFPPSDNRPPPPV